MRRPMLTVVALATVGLCAACSSSLGAARSTSTPPPALTTSPATSSTTQQVDPNVEVCNQVQTYVVSTIKQTFHQWRPQVNEFDTKVGGELRDEATHLFSLAAKSAGVVTQAIHDEATALTNISIAIDEQDDGAVGNASNAANTALAALRGSCNF